MYIAHIPGAEIIATCEMDAARLNCMYCMYDRKQDSGDTKQGRDEVRLRLFHRIGWGRASKCQDRKAVRSNVEVELLAAR